MQGNRTSSFTFTLCLLLLIALLTGSVGAQQPLPVPTGPGLSGGKVFISPSVLRALQDDNGKDLSGAVGVIVNFDTSKGRNSLQNTVDDISAARASVLAAIPAGSYELVASFNRIPAVALRVNSTAIEALAQAPGVYAINANQVIKTTMTEANALTGADTIQGIGITGEGVRAAIIDTGVDSAASVVHAGLADDLFEQECFLDLETPGACIGGTGSAEDQHGHGTHVAGMITGPQGVAPDVEFAALKVFSTGSTTDVVILGALDWVIDWNTSNPSEAADIDLINMSLGGDNFSDQASCDAGSAAYVTAFGTLNGQGVANFVATGNDAMTTEVSSPGCATGAIGVGSTGDATFTIGFGACTDNAQPDKVSCYSNATNLQGAGELVDLLAPGCDILSLGLDNTSGADSCGTSMATPYALGVGALVQEASDIGGSPMTPAALEAHLEATGVGVTDYRIAGSVTFPRVDALASVGGMLGTPPANFTITGTTTTTVSMQWDAVASADSYEVFVSKDGGAYASAGTTTAPTVTFTDSAAACGALTYYVVSVDGGLPSLASNTDTDTARACPLAPTGLTLTVVNATDHDLDWTDAAADETGYVLEKQTNGGGFTALPTLPAGTTHYDDDGLACALYDYRVKAIRGADESAYSNTVSRAICAPDNDLFANSELVNGAADSSSPDVTDVEANIKYASVSVGDPVHTCAFGGASTRFQNVWYTVTAAADVQLLVNTNANSAINTGGTPDTVVSVYTHDGAAFTQRACDDDAGTGFNSSLSYAVTAGTTVYVQVSQWEELLPSATGSLSVTFGFDVAQFPPSHDEYAGRKVISATPYTDTVAGAQLATTTVGDPTHTCRIGGAGVGSHNMWYSFTPQFNGTVDIDTETSSGSYTDTILSAYTGTYGAFTGVGCDDDGGTSLLSFINDMAVTGGTTYTIVVSRWSATPTATAGTMVLHLSFTPAAGEVGVTPTSVDVAEGGATDSYDVVLSSAPTDIVTITITDDAQCDVSAPTLTFTSGDFSTPQTVTVTATDDAIAEGAHTCTITHAAASSDAAYNGDVPSPVTGNITDDDVAGVTVAPPTNATVEEGGATDTYDVSLDSEPTGDVTITVTDDAQCDVSSPTLTFTSLNYMTAQTITVTATDDAVVEGAHTCTITHSAASTDLAYDAIAVASVTGDITDNDIAVTDLLTNGDFELDADTNNIPDGWTTTGQTKAMTCLVGQAHSGSCAGLIKGSLLQNRKIKQLVDYSGVTLAVGDTLDMAAFVKSTKSLAKVQFFVKVFADSSLVPLKVKLNVGQLVAYTEVNVPQLTLTSANVDKIVVMIKNRTLSGKALVDLAELLHTPAGSRSAEVLPPPSAPGGMRGSN